MKTRTFVFVLVILGSLLMLAGRIREFTPAADPWWEPADGAWRYRIRLQFNFDGAGEPLQQQTVMIKLPRDWSGYAYTQAHGEDLRLVDPQSQSLLPHQIAQWHVWGESIVYVRVPVIRPGHASAIYLYYGNASAPDGQQRGATWGPDYRAVWLLNENGNSGLVGVRPGPFRDSAAGADSWGNAGMAVNLGYPAVYAPAVGSPAGWNTQLRYAVYDAGSDTTYVVYPGGALYTAGEPITTTILESPNDPYLTTYNHRNGTWTAPVKIGDAYGPPDTHYYPTLLIVRDPQTQAAQLHVFQAGHIRSGHHIKQWVHALDGNFSSGWTETVIEQAELTAYPNAFVNSLGHIYIFYRRTVSNAPHWYEPEDYVASTDGGRSWSVVKPAIDPGVDGRWYDDWATLYTKAMLYRPALGERPEGVYMLFGTHYLHFVEQDKQFFVFFALNDGGGYRARHFYSAAGQDLGTAIDRRDYDDPDPGACPACLAWREHVAGYFPRTSIVVAGDGAINVFYNLKDFSIHWIYFDRERGAWIARPGLPGFGRGHSGMPYDARLNTDGSIDLFVASYPPGLPQPSFLQYRYDGGEWRRVDVIFVPAETPDVNWFTFVEHAKPDGLLEAVFVEMNITIFTHPNAAGKLYAWGERGLLKGNLRAEVRTSPAGPAVDFLPYSYAPEGARLRDHIRVVHSDAFDFAPQNDVAVELLVSFHPDSLPSATQYVLGKDADHRGFSVRYNGAIQRLEWIIGDGSRDQVVTNPVPITAGRWYDVMATYDQAAHTASLWVNGVASSRVLAGFLPDWGTADLRLGAPSAPSPQGRDYLDGTLGGYVTIRDTLPTPDAIRASKQNFLDGTFVTLGPPECWPRDCTGPR
jgi:hypothetical protein